MWQCSANMSLSRLRLAFRHSSRRRTAQGVSRLSPLGSQALRFPFATSDNAHAISSQYWPVAYASCLSYALGIITLEFANHYVVGVYAPNAGDGLKVSPSSPPTPDRRPCFKLRCACSALETESHMSHLQNMDHKEAWNAAFEKYLRELDATKPVIWTGDVNVVPTENGTRCSASCP